MTWDPQRVEILKQLWAEGLSASQIASGIGGITRNAVTGKALRIGLPQRALSSLARKPMAPRVPRAPRPTRLRQPRPRSSPAGRPTKPPHPAHVPYDAAAFDRDDVAHTTLIDREPGQCSWVIGEPRHGRMCGLPVAPGARLEWCPKHLARGCRQPDGPDRAEVIHRVVAEKTEDLRPTPMNAPTEPIAIEVSATAEMPSTQKSDQRIETADVVGRGDNVAHAQSEFIFEGAVT